MSERRSLQSPIEHIHKHVCNLMETHKLEDLYINPEWQSLVRLVNDWNMLAFHDSVRRSNKAT